MVLVGLGLIIHLLSFVSLYKKICYSIPKRPPLFLSSVSLSQTHAFFSSKVPGFTLLYDLHCQALV